MKNTVLAVIFALLAPVALFAAHSARLEFAKGKIEVQRGGTSEWVKVDAKIEVFQGDKIRTFDSSSATLFLDDGSTVEITAWSLFMVDFYESEKFQFKLAMGSIRAFVRSFKRRSFQVVSPVAVCAVRGTNFDMSVDKDQDYKTRIGVDEGKVWVKDNFGKEVVLAKNDSVDVTKDGMGPVVNSQAKDDASDAKTKLPNFWKALVGVLIAGAVIAIAL